MSAVLKYDGSDMLDFSCKCFLIRRWQMKTWRRR